MKICSTIEAVAVTLLATFASCVDETYNIDDLNTDVEVAVNDLVVPINLDAITLSNVFDLDDESVVKQIDGVGYAVVLDGAFNSEPITVSSVEVTPVSIGTIKCDIFEYKGTDFDWPVDAQTISYEVTPVKTSYSFSCTNVSRIIRALDNVECNWDIELNLTLDDANRLFSKLEFKHLVINVPAGLHVSNYPCENARVTVGDISVSTTGATSVKLHVDKIDFTKFDAGKFTFTPATGDVDNGTITLNDGVGVQSGFVVGQTRQTMSSEYQKVVLNVNPVMGTLKINTVSGVIGYALNTLNVDDVTLNDLPDLLRREGTNVSLTNPQLYLSLNNPVATYKLSAQSGLTLTAMKGSQAVNVCPLNPGQNIILGYDKGIVGPYNFCLSPTAPASYFAGYENAVHVGYERLAHLLSGDGLPDYIHIDFNNPRVNEGRVTNFKLGTTIGSVAGDYTLFAPLELSVGSQIVYEDDETGWEDETIQKITVKTIKITATVTNTLPVDIELTGTPLTAQGTPCVDPETRKDVSLTSSTVPAGQTADIEIKNIGTIVGIDGIRYKATCQVTEAGKTLAPESPITLTNIKVTIGGYYRDTL